MKDKFLSAMELLELVPVVISPRCRKEYERCVRQCYKTRDERLANNQIQRGRIELQRLNDIRDCTFQNIGNEQARIECQRQVNAAADTALAQLAARDDAIRVEFDRCMAKCSQDAKDCDNKAQFYGAIASPTVTIEVECIDGTNAPCFKKVREICKKISGPCGDCFRSLCGDNTWFFESDIPLAVSLVAATNPKKNTRVLSRISKKGKVVALPIPKQIKLNGKEQLYIGFSSNKRLAKPVRVIIHRSRKPIV